MEEQIGTHHGRPLQALLADAHREALAHLGGAAQLGQRLHHVAPDIGRQHLERVTGLPVTADVLRQGLEVIAQCLIL
ncbi:hypothetical protein D3C84_990390 [compost metagenome]